MNNQHYPNPTSSSLSSLDGVGFDEAIQSIPFLVFDVSDADGWDSLDMPTILVAQQVLVALSEREEILAELELSPSDVAAALAQIAELRSKSERALATAA